MTSYIDMVNIGKRKRSLKTEHKLESLDFYIKLTKQLIAKHAGNIARSLLCNDDCVANLAHQVMLADVYFDGKGELCGYRKQRFKWGLCAYFERLKKTQEVKIRSLDQCIDSHLHGDNKLSNLISGSGTTPLTQLIKAEAQQEVDQILDSGFITDQQKTYIKKYFGIYPHVERMTMEAIAKEHGVTKNNVSLVINRGLKSLKEYCKQ